MKDDESIRTGCNTQVERCTQPQHNQTKSKSWVEGMQKQAVSIGSCCVSPQQKPLKTGFYSTAMMKWNGLLENILTQVHQMYPYLQGCEESFQSNKTRIERINMLCFFILTWPTVKVRPNLCVWFCVMKVVRPQRKKAFITISFIFKWF